VEQTGTVTESLPVWCVLQCLYISENFSRRWWYRAKLFCNTEQLL